MPVECFGAIPAMLLHLFLAHIGLHRDPTFRLGVCRVDAELFRLLFEWGARTARTPWVDRSAACTYGDMLPLEGVCWEESSPTSTPDSTPELTDASTVDEGSDSGAEEASGLDVNERQDLRRVRRRYR